MLNRKILAIAVASTFAGGVGVASAANITLPSTATASPVYSSNMNGGALTNTNVLGGLTGWGFSSGTAVFVRYDLSGATFTADPSAMTLGLGSTTTVLANATATKSAGGAGASNAIYQVTSANSSETLSTANTLLTLAGLTVTSTAADATITQSIYDTSSNAVAGGATGKLATSKTGVILSFTPAYTVTVTAGSANTADVSATLGSYKSFTGSVATQTAALGTIVIANGTSAVINDGVSPATVGNTVTSNTKLVITGDFTAAANANGTYTGAALSRVFLSNTSCNSTGGNAVANSLTATTAWIQFGNATSNVASGASANQTLCLSAAGNSAIPVATYTVQYVPVAVTANTVSSTTAATIGSIARNGGQLTTPWMTFATGWTSRVILTNSSSADATYAVAVKGEAGNTVTANATGATGTVPANGMVVVNASDIVTSISGNTRFAATFTFAAARTTIDGMAQAVNAATGAISSVTMVSPGTN